MEGQSRRMPENGLSDLRLLQLISPNLPTGAFTYSQGMEWAVECGWVTNADETRQWLASVLQDSLRYLELPLLLRLYAAAKDQDAPKFLYWSQWLYASRETLELRHEEIQRARALLTVLRNLPERQDWHELDEWEPALLRSQLAGFSLAAGRWFIPLPKLMQAYAWSWLENAVVAAIKLVPLGQSEGQRLLYELAASIETVVEQAREVEDEDIGASTLALAIASSRHEHQYSRLFRS